MNIPFINRKSITIAFVIMVIAQWIVPISIIYSKEKVSEKGQAFKFELQGIDPHDPFRGKFLILNPIENQLDLVQNQQLRQKMYASFYTGENGFAKIKSLGIEKPDHDYYLKVNVNRATRANEEKQIARLTFPFDKYFVPEDQAKEAEKRLLDAVSSENQKAYTTVRVYKGNYKVENLYVNDQAILSKIE